MQVHELPGRPPVGLPSLPSVFQPSCEIKHPAALRRPLPVYNRPFCFDTDSRGKAQLLAAQGEWGVDSDAARILQREYLAYYIVHRPGQNDLATLYFREYLPIWHCIMGQWQPVLAWESCQAGRQHLEGETQEYLYDGNDARSVTVLAERVEAKLERLGFPIPSWFDHPCPVDLCHNSGHMEPTSRADYSSTVADQFPNLRPLLGSRRSEHVV